MVLKKGAWSPEEDKKLITYIKRYGIWNWTRMAGPAGLSRSGKSCRLRWLNYLSPNVKRGKFASEEDQIITRMHQLLGNKWSVIAAAIPGRTDNEIKNHWHTNLQKRRRKRVTKKPQVSGATSHDSYVRPQISPLPYVLESSAETSSSTSSSSGTYGSEQMTEESPEASNCVREDLYLENQQQVSDESSEQVPTSCDFWDAELTSPFDFYSNSYTSYDFWSTLNVLEDGDGLLIDPIFQF